MDDANAFVDSSRTQWKVLVQFAAVTPKNNRRQAAATLAMASGVSKSNLQKKFEAIHFHLENGISKAELIDKGQNWCMGKFVKEKAAGRQDLQVTLKWMVEPKIRDAAQALFNRIGLTLNLKTPDERWTYFLGIFADATDVELWHQAGEDKRAQNKSNP